jgi:hypothetical protein
LLREARGGGGGFAASERVRARERFAAHSVPGAERRRGGAQTPDFVRSLDVQTHARAHGGGELGGDGARRLETSQFEFPGLDAELLELEHARVHRAPRRELVEARAGNASRGLGVQERDPVHVHVQQRLARRSAM